MVAILYSSQCVTYLNVFENSWIGYLISLPVNNTWEVFNFFLKASMRPGFTFLCNFTNVWSCYFLLLWNLMCFSTWLLPNCQPHFTWVNTQGSNIISLTRLRVRDMLVSKLAVNTLISNLLPGKVNLFNENICELISETDNHGCWWYRVKLVSMMKIVSNVGMMISWFGNAFCITGHLWWENKTNET